MHGSTKCVTAGVTTAAAHKIIFSESADFSVEHAGWANATSYDQSARPINKQTSKQRARVY